MSRGRFSGFRGLLGGRGGALAGIDISSTSVKVVTLSKNCRQLESYVSEPLPQGAVVERNIVQPDVVGNAIQVALKRGRIQAKEAAVAVSGSAVITKTIPMPADLSDNELENQITLEAGQYIPFPLEDVNFDFQRMGPVPNNPGQVNVLLAASRKENVEGRVAAVEMSDLKVRIVDIEAYAMENAFSLLPAPAGMQAGEGVAALVDMGASSMNLHVFQRGESVFTREQAFGCRQVNDQIRQDYGVSEEDAEAIKRGLMPQPEEYEERILSPYRENVARQLNRALQFFYSSSHLDSVDYVVLAGGCAAMGGLDRQIQQAIGMPVMVANPFVAISHSSRINSTELQKDGPALMVACGLAMRGCS